MPDLPVGQSRPVAWTFGASLGGRTLPPTSAVFSARSGRRRFRLAGQRNKTEVTIPKGDVM